MACTCSTLSKYSLRSCAYNNSYFYFYSRKSLKVYNMRGNSTHNGLFHKLTLSAVIVFLVVGCLCYKSHDQPFWNSAFDPFAVVQNELSYELIFVTLGLIDVIIGETLVRLFVFIEELIYIRSRYDGRIYSVIQQSFSSKTYVPFLTLPILVAMMTYMNLTGAGMSVVGRIMQTKWNYAFLISISLISYLLRLHVSK